VYGIVNQSGGYLALDSAPGQGASFKMFFPRVHEEMKLAEPVALHRTVAARETVLLVEDEDVVRGLASTILHRSGYQVLEARACDQALQISKEHSGPIHALVTDVVMPQMSGPQLAGLIQTIRRDIKILYISGYTNELISDHGVLDSGTMFLQKPFSPEAFASKMHELLKKHGGAA
jgi:CheY-like chemotaxis protein